MSDRNYIINGDFNIWQRGTMFGGTGFAGYTADRWNVQSIGQITATQRTLFVQGQTAVPGEPEYYLTTALGGTPPTQTPFLYQSIESVRTLAGQTVTISFYASSSINVTIPILLLQQFNNGGVGNTTTPTTTVNLSPTWTLFTATFTLASIASKTIVSPGDCLVLIFYFPTLTPCTLNFAQVKVEAGGTATPFEPLPYQQELALCQRYYEKSFEIETKPGSGLGRTGALEFNTIVAPVFSPISSLWPASFKVQKRAVPTMTWYSPSSATAQVYNETLSLDCTGTTTDINSISTWGFSVVYTSNGINQNVNEVLSVHWTADSEF